MWCKATGDGPLPPADVLRSDRSFGVVRRFAPDDGPALHALLEARRCLSCGSCFSCDNCFAVCPDNAVVKLGMPGEPYAIDLDYCKGCGLCAEECPAGAIAMSPEEV